MVPTFLSTPKSSARPILEASPVQELPEGLGVCLASPDAAIASSLLEHDLDVRRSASSSTKMVILGVPNREGGPASHASDGAPLLVYAHYWCGGPILPATSMVTIITLAGVEAHASADAQPAMPAAAPATVVAQSSALAAMTLSANTEAQSTLPAASFIDRMSKRLDGAGIRLPQVSI
jgi:hypothetical protein